jgi:VIT1/CCC1 family predicted Fe2+/Mn2+ transporter
MIKFNIDNISYDYTVDNKRRCILMAVDPTTLMNFIFGVIIVILGFWVFRLKKYTLALYVAIGFGLFAISWLEILLGATSSNNISIILLRALGYLVVIFALFREAVLK